MSGNAFRREMRDKSWRTDVQEKAEAAGYRHHYVTTRALCDRLPDMPGWDALEPPVFHFPLGKALNRTEIARDALNLGIMADLVYAAEAKNPIIDYFFPA